MIKKVLKNSIFHSILGAIIVFLLWFLFYFIVANTYLIPSPLLVIKESVLNFFSGEFYIHLLNTLLRVICALFISVIVAVILSILSSNFKTFENVMLPIIAIMRSLPILAVLLIIIVSMPRDIAPIIVCFLSIFPIIYSESLNYLNSIDSKQKEMLKIYNVPLKKQIFSVYLKGYLPLFIKQLTALFSFSLKLIVSAEILANVFKSIGGDISNASTYSNVLELFSLTLIICLIGIIVEFIGKFIYLKMEKKFRWK